MSIIAANDNLQSLSSLTVANATAALERGLAAIRAGQTSFDLRHVLMVDSVAVSVMLAWRKAAQDAGVELELKHLPPALQSLTKLYGVCSLLFPTTEQLEPGAAPADNPAHAEFAPVVGAPAPSKLGLGNAPAESHHHH